MAPTTGDGPTVVGFLTQAAAVVGAVTTLGGLAWWLLAPRVRAYLETVAANARTAAHELDPERTGSTAEAVRAARELAEQIPQLSRRLELVEQRTEPLDELTQLVHSNTARLDSTEGELVDHRRRLGNVEEALITGRIYRHAQAME